MDADRRGARFQRAVPTFLSAWVSTAQRAGRRAIEACRHEWRHSTQECVRHVCRVRFHHLGVQGRGESTTENEGAFPCAATRSRLSQRGVAHFLSLLFAKLRELFLQPRVVVG